MTTMLNDDETDVIPEVCGTCGDNEDIVGPLESSCDGSMCDSCYQDHICECKVCS